MVRSDEIALASFAARREASRLGIAMAATIAMMITTTSSSTSEKPFWFFFDIFLNLQGVNSYFSNLRERTSAPKVSHNTRHTDSYCSLDADRRNTCAAARIPERSRASCNEVNRLELAPLDEPYLRTRKKVRLSFTLGKRKSHFSR